MCDKKEKIKYLNSYKNYSNQTENEDFYINEIEHFINMAKFKQSGEIRKQHEKLMLMLTIKDKIENINSEIYKNILIYRYLKSMKWEDIGEKMGYSLQHLHRLHNKALEEFKM